MGRVLVRGEYGPDIIDERKPVPGEPIIDKPGKGAFFATDLDLILKNRGVRSLIVTRVTTEVCVQTTAREANDRGYECLVLEDCVGSYFTEFHRVALELIKTQGGIVGWVSNSAKLLRPLGSQPDRGPGMRRRALCDAVQVSAASRLQPVNSTVRAAIARAFVCVGPPLDAPDRAWMQMAGAQT
jgi:hypothetical protein